MCLFLYKNGIPLQDPQKERSCWESPLEAFPPLNSQHPPLTAASQCSSLHKQPQGLQSSDPGRAWPGPRTSWTHQESLLFLKGWSHGKQLNSSKMSIPLCDSGHQDTTILQGFSGLSTCCPCREVLWTDATSGILVSALCGSLQSTPPYWISGVSL